MAGLEPARANYSPTDFKSVASTIPPHRRCGVHSKLLPRPAKMDFVVRGELISRPELGAPAQTFFLCQACCIEVLYLARVHSISSANCSIRRGLGITFVP